MRSWIYDSSGSPVTIVRPVGFARPVETRPFQEKGHDAHGTVQNPAREWWQGPQHFGQVPLLGRR